MEELGLYVNSLIYGFDFEENDEKVLLDYRKSLEESINLGKETLDTLYEKAKKIDPKAVENISKTDKKRIFRILEIYYLSHIIKTEIDKKRRKKDITKNIVKDHSINDFTNLNNINFNNKDKKIETSALNIALKDWLQAAPPPQGRQTAFTFKYIVQTGSRPPEFLLFSNRPDYVTESYMRYIQNKIRSDLGFEMIPILLKVKGSRKRWEERL